MLELKPPKNENSDYETFVPVMMAYSQDLKNQT